MSESDLLNWHTLIIGMAIGGTLATIFFIIQSKQGKTLEQLSREQKALKDKRKEFAKHEIIFTLNRMWWDAKKLVKTFEMNGVKDEYDKKVNPKLKLILKDDIDSFHRNFEHLRTLAINFYDVIEPPELSSQLLSLCRDIDNRLAERFMGRFAIRWPIVIEDIGKFAKNNWPDEYSREFNASILDNF